MVAKRIAAFGPQSFISWARVPCNGLIVWRRNQLVPGASDRFDEGLAERRQRPPQPANMDVDAADR